MNEVGFIKTSHSCHWRIPDWSKLCLCTEYSSPPLYIDDLKWTIKLYKGRPKSPNMLSLFVKLHETSPGSLRGIRKKVQLILKVHNTNPSNYYNDFGVGKRLHPVWFSEKHTKWGEDALAPLNTLDPFLNQNQASLSINISILKSEVDLIPPVAAPGRSPFANYFDSPEFSDIHFRVQDCDSKERLFRGHKNILAAMSPWFRGLFSSGMRESFENVIDVQGVSAEIFSRLLQYCYTFNVNIHSVQDAQDLLEAADQFQMVTVREEALRYMRQEINETNVWNIWSWADMYDCEKTCAACLDFAARNLTTLIKQPSWLEAKAAVVKKAMQIEEGILPTEEELYEALMEWAKYPATQQKITDQEQEGKDGTKDSNGIADDRQGDLAEIIQFIRFPLIQPTFLATVIENDPFIMKLDCTRDLLFEAYRYHALGEPDGSSFRCRSRRTLPDE